MFPIRFRDASMTPFRYFCQKEQYFFFTRHPEMIVNVYCLLYYSKTNNRQHRETSGQNWVKIRILLSLLLFAHSLTQFDDSRGFASYRRQQPQKAKNKAMTLKTTKLRLLNVIIFHPIVKLVNRASLCAIMPK